MRVGHLRGPRVVGIGKRATIKRCPRGPETHGEQIGSLASTLSLSPSVTHARIGTRLECAQEWPTFVLSSFQQARHNRARPLHTFFMKILGRMSSLFIQNKKADLRLPLTAAIRLFICQSAERERIKSTHRLRRASRCRQSMLYS